MVSNVDANSLDAEKHVLSAMLESQEAIVETAAILEPSDFLSPAHETIAEAMFQLDHSGQPVDLVLLNDHLMSTGKMGQAGGFAAVAELLGYTPVATNVGFYAEIVATAARRRRLADVGVTMIELSNDQQVTADELAERGKQLLDGATREKRADTMDSAHAVQDVLDHQGETKVGIPTPWFTLTGTIRGFRPGGFYVMAARPGIGKSALALQMAHRAEQFGHVGFFTLEMDAKEVATRLIAQESGVTLSLIEGHDPLPEFAKFKVDQWASQYQGRILFDERSNITMNEMHAQARAWTKKHGKLSMIVIDYLQLMSGPQNLSRQEFISSVTRGLKIMAKELQVPVVALSQLNRNSENRTDKRPILADLRESGSIEQDADVVFLLHRDAAPNMADTDHAALELIVAKNRQGPTENHMLSWQGEFVRAVL